MFPRKVIDITLSESRDFLCVLHLIICFRFRVK